MTVYIMYPYSKKKWSVCSKDHYDAESMKLITTGLSKTEAISLINKLEKEEEKKQDKQISRCCQ